ncbi:MAG TPA: ABC transporter ATP-binding protein [Microthrixaceae bacterium]|nr:ABC transporter ATP-binding protein [Microthrixaceae bacterium]
MSRLLELRGLRAGYRGAEVVRGIDLGVDRGEVVALLGANGAGKTTTLLAISGLIRPMGGEVEVDGVRAPSGRRMRATVTRRARQGLGHVPEDRSLFADLTVAEHVRLAGSRREGSLAAEQVVDWFPTLGTVWDRPAGVLSGGEQQMLAVARALVARPRMLLVDELSLGLAPLVTAQLLRVLRDVADHEGVGVLIVEQHVSEVLEVADRGVVLAGGEVTVEAAAAALADQPDLLAAAYLGSATS